MDRDATLREVEQRVLWLATAIVDHANRVRPNPDGLKVGGHQASSASMVTIMTALWFEHLRPEDRVSVKPHASPVLHAINYLLGELSAPYLTTLREFGGLQSYPSRAKDPDTVDYSTGSVGIGATAPIWGALARRYVDAHLGAAGTGRQYSLVGDAELDEGAVLGGDPRPDGRRARRGRAGSSTSTGSRLDRVVPNIGATRLQGMFAAAGWQVLTVKYGRLLQELFARPGGDALRRRIDEMANPEYQRLLRCTARPAARAAARRRHGRRASPSWSPALDDATLHAAIRNLGGHDLGALREAFAAIDDTRPTVIFAYTRQGLRPGHRGPPAEPLLAAHRGAVGRAGRAGSGVDPTDPWAPLPGRRRPQAALCARRRRPAAPRRRSRPRAGPAVPDRPRPHPGGHGHHPGRARPHPARPHPRRARTPRRGWSRCRPDVSSSTNLGGWVNKVGVWSARERVDWFADDPETILHWRERPTGQHLELGIAETNLVGLLGELGATWSRWGAAAAADRRALRPVRRARAGAVVVRHLRGRPVDPGRHPVRGHARPGGRRPPVDHHAVGRAGAARLHHATSPRSRIDVEWTLLAALARLGRPGRHARPTCGCPPGRWTRRSPRCPTDPAARERRRRQVVAGGYPLRRARRPARGDDRGDGRGRARGAGRGRPARRRSGIAGRRRVRDQPRPAVRRRAGPRAGRGDARELDPRRRLPGPAGRAAGHRARRAPAHAGVPRRGQPGARGAPGRDARSASPATSTRSTATTASTPTRSSAPRWT